MLVYRVDRHVIFRRDQNEKVELYHKIFRREEKRRKAIQQEKKGEEMKEEIR